jgi:hypothetical protein
MAGGPAASAQALIVRLIAETQSLRNCWALLTGLRAWKTPRLTTDPLCRLSNKS